MGEGEFQIEHPQVSKRARHRKKLLYKSILQLMEFYFSNSNLSKDRFLSQLIQEDPFIDLNIFLKFNKIRKLNCTLDDIRKAISKSNLIELSECKEKIKRKHPIKVNENVDTCTLYVENIKSDANHEWISQIFSEFGNVVYVSIPKYKHNRTNKGFAFVEFEDEESANNALTYFENIGCKMPSETDPENLRSIQTFEDQEQNKKEESVPVKEENICNKAEEGASSLANVCIKAEEGASSLVKMEGTEEYNIKKRKLEEVEDNSIKKFKSDTIDADVKQTENENVEADDTENKKKRKHKDKRKNFMKELGFQVLSKKEWKKMRNRYLDLQKKKMKEFKQHLFKQKFNQNYQDKFKRGTNDDNVQEKNVKEEPCKKLEFVSGVILKISLPEPVLDTKKFKSDMKALSSDIEHIDFPIPSGNEEVFMRFSNTESATEFCSKESIGEKTLLKDDEEKEYWEKIFADRTAKFAKGNKKQRGRDKLLKKAEKERAKHIRFEEGD